MKACIYGAGAIGGWLGVAPAQAGHTLSMVARGDTLRALPAGGLGLRRPRGRVPAQDALTENERRHAMPQGSKRISAVRRRRICGTLAIERTPVRFRRYTPLVLAANLVTASLRSIRSD